MKVMCHEDNLSKQSKTFLIDICFDEKVQCTIILDYKKRHI